MKFVVLIPLILNISFDGFLISMLTDGVDVVTTRPEFPAPEDLSDLGVAFEQFPGCDALNDLDNSLRGLHGY